MPKVVDARERFGYQRQPCQCARWREPCGANATAEDLRCDACRGRCQYLQVYASDGVRVALGHVICVFDARWG